MNSFNGPSTSSGIFSSPEKKKYQVILETLLLKTIPEVMTNT